jgi:diguanylate cyclase (GGDEF)-like protein
VTETMRLHRELRHQATYDGLTRCHNRASIMAELSTILADDEHTTVGTAVIFMDLDDFKPVNDNLGHAAGDALLQIVSDRLRSVVREYDVVGRLGGDEFLAVLPSVTDPREAMKIAGRMAALLGQEVNLPAGRVKLSASIGVAWSNRPGLGADAFVGLADVAMYQSKNDGQGVPVLAGVAASAAPPTELPPQIVRVVPPEDRRPGRSLRTA